MHSGSATPPSYICSPVDKVFPVPKPKDIKQRDKQLSESALFEGDNQPITDNEEEQFDALIENERLRKLLAEKDL
jgi:hypothetical protein